MRFARMRLIELKKAHRCSICGKEIPGGQTCYLGSGRRYIHVGWCSDEHRRRISGWKDFHGIDSQL